MPKQDHDMTGGGGSFSQGRNITGAHLQFFAHSHPPSFGPWERQRTIKKGRCHKPWHNLKPVFPGLQRYWCPWTPSPTRTRIGRGVPLQTMPGFFYFFIFSTSQKRMIFRFRCCQKFFLRGGGSFVVETNLCILEPSKNCHLECPLGCFAADHILHMEGSM